MPKLGDFIVDGKKLFMLRESKHLGRNELAKLADMSPSALQTIEQNSAKNVRFSTLRKLAKGLGVDQQFLADLIGADSNLRFIVTSLGTYTKLQIKAQREVPGRSVEKYLDDLAGTVDLDVKRIPSPPGAGQPGPETHGGERTGGHPKDHPTKNLQAG